MYSKILFKSDNLENVPNPLKRKEDWATMSENLIELLQSINVIVIN